MIQQANEKAGNCEGLKEVKAKGKKRARDHRKDIWKTKYFFM